MSAASKIRKTFTTKLRGEVSRKSASASFILPFDTRDIWGMARVPVRVTITLEKDNEKREIEIPLEIRKGLGSKLIQKMEAFSYSHKKEWIDWYSAAKKPETRARRIDKMKQVL